MVDSAVIVGHDQGCDLMHLGFDTLVKIESRSPIMNNVGTSVFLPFIPAMSSQLKSEFR